jgi:putative transposase
MTLEAAGSQADVQHLCRLAGLPRATYYRHLARRGAERAQAKS